VNFAQVDSTLNISEGRRGQRKAKEKKSLKEPIILTIDENHKILLKDILNDLKAVTSAKKINEGKFNIEFIEKDQKIEN